jgi:hypothetical protein
MSVGRPQLGKRTLVELRVLGAGPSYLAEREGFEPPIPLRVCRISSAVHSTALPPLQLIDLYYYFGPHQAAEMIDATEIATETN